jgi:glucans biosynthesis protein
MISLQDSMKPVLGSFILLLLVSTVSRVIAADGQFEDVRGMAEDLSHKDFKPSRPVAQKYLDLNFDQYSGIQFLEDKARWKKEGRPFYLEFFPAGYLHNQIVVIHEVEGQASREIPFDPALFKSADGATLPADLGYAGFKINQPVANFIEVASFLDATYFRMLGRGQDYGTSARGLALNLVGDEKEEFPVFKQFWIVKPGVNDHTITVYALMDSPSVAGAYGFTIQPGEETVATVKAVLYLRRAVKEFGIAPLTSMFLFGKNGHAPLADFRPEVHDADGLLMQNGKGEWIWRPLDQGKMTRVDAFQDESPRGFGLMQRDRNFEDYQDLVERYQRRPSVWVQPVGNWGKGAVELVELASDLETSDNISAFWVPATPPAPGSRLDLQYQLHWTTTDPSPANLGHVRAMRISRINGKPAHLRFVIDFDGAAMESIPAGEKLASEINCSEGALIVSADIFKNEFNHTWRLVIETIEPTKATNLRASLKRGEHAVTETWNYTWQP